MRASQDIKTSTSIKEVLSSLCTMQDYLFEHTGLSQHDHAELGLLIGTSMQQVATAVGKILSVTVIGNHEMHNCLFFHVCPAFTPPAPPEPPTPPAPPPRPSSDDVELQRLNFYLMTMLAVVFICVMVYIPGCWVYRAWAVHYRAWRARARERDEAESQVHQPVLETVMNMVCVVADTRREEEAARQQEDLLAALLLQQAAEVEVPEAAESSKAASEADTAEGRLEATLLEDIARMSPDPDMHASMSKFLVAFTTIHTELCKCIVEIATAEDITERLESVENVCVALIEDAEHASVAQILQCELALVADTRLRMQTRKEMDDLCKKLKSEMGI
jgi:hypothetical protein